VPSSFKYDIKQTMVKNSGNEVGRPLWKIELNKKTPAGAEY
jgi:hypothetical protein